MTGNSLSEIFPVALGVFVNSSSETFPEGVLSQRCWRRPHPVEGKRHDHNCLAECCELVGH